MAGMHDIKARIKSVESTMQITKAMELVATSKLRRAKETIERTRPFYKVLGKAISDIAGASDDVESVWFERREAKKTLFIVFGGDRGLAGGYNANVFRLAESLAKDTEAVWMPIGKKALEYLRHRNRNIYTDAYEYAADQSVGSMLTLGGIVCEGFKAGAYDNVVIIYTEFVSMMSQKVTHDTLLPLTDDNESDCVLDTDCCYEEMLEKIIPQYIGGILYTALCESLASESGARRAAMNSANKNAEEMIDTLMLTYNRARQAVITQEITEIVSGAEAL